MSKTFQPQLISCKMARALVEAALGAAEAQQVAVAVAVVDALGQLKAFAAMDGVPLLALEACQRKAHTALLGLPSQALGEALSSNPPALFSMAAFPTQTLLPGGFPLFVDGALVGAIGVGGATIEQDVSCAQAALVLLAS